ncbi:hypothetical protein FK529_17090 [Tsukamurella asaccharolytica]|uniref:Uncharacterized protein n=1 Tax=Tsukamurella asaccharolytica TaxID=2592067 RepID=A0A5C5R6V3_9ACTN|nr:hypothetical protein [Tsukamurella asaccharolytica]TWS18053.1 hypothetical protein FK529_17090 [Tsukamurella asaccharolytica]
MNSTPIIASVVLAVVGAALGFLATRSAGSLPKGGAEDSLNTARGILGRAGGAVAASFVVCLLAGLVGVATGREFAPAEMLIVGLLPQVALCAAVLRPVASPGVIGGALSPRRLRDLVPWALPAAAGVLLVPGTLSAIALIYLGAQPLGTPESNRLGFGCEVPAGPNVVEPLSGPLDVGSPWWPVVQLVLMWGSVLIAVVAVRHCHRRPSVVSDGAVDSALRRCLATRSSSAAVLVVVLTAGFASATLEDLAANRPRMSDFYAQISSHPNGWPRLHECALSDGVLSSWALVGDAAGWTRSAGVLVVVWAIACYLFPGRLIRTSPRQAEGVRIS